MDNRFVRQSALAAGLVSRNNVAGNRRGHAYCRDKGQEGDANKHPHQWRRLIYIVAIAFNFEQESLFRYEARAKLGR